MSASRSQDSPKPSRRRVKPAHSTGTPASHEKPPSQQPATRKPVTRKPAVSRQKRSSGSSQHPRNRRSVRLVLIGMLLVALILIGIIITLDHRAMKRGQIGLWETISGIRPARTAVDVESMIAAQCESYGLGKDAVRRIGYTTIEARENERLRHIVYHVSDAETFRSLTETFEDRVRRAGVRVHNRHLMKQPREWIMSFYAGTYATRTHKIDFQYFLQGTPTPVPVPTGFPIPAATQSATEQSVGRTGPRIALIFDDFGRDTAIAQRFLRELDVPVTLAVIPYQEASREIVSMIRQAKQTAFLHMPMEPLDASAMGNLAAHYLTVSMDDAALRSNTRRMLDDYPGITGVNNHTGSKLTRDRRAMTAVLKAIRDSDRDLIFIDSRTIADTVAETVARELDIPTASRNVFLDQGTNGGDVATNMERLLKTAEEKGQAIGIGHAIGSTLDQVRAAIPEIHRRGIRIVPVNDLVH
ncbi:divergent polysaccharide deacetylase family protein [bacterium]|nr:divergent polysaccharide deacetylase family protein [candidate division CSSED10-310 bacterium]